jgi:hypothetical protein
VLARHRRGDYDHVRYRGLMVNLYFMKGQTQSQSRPALDSIEAVERFRKAAKAFTSRAVKSQDSARKVLVDEGIYTKAGKLTKRYS